MLVKDYMNSSTVTITDDADYKSAFAVMEQNNIHHLPVVNGEEALVGMLALRDLKIAANCYRESPIEVVEIMHTPVLTAQSDDPIQKAAEIMSEHKIGCLPVVDGDNHLTGILTESDLFRALSDALTN